MHTWKHLCFFALTALILTGCGKNLPLAAPDPPAAATATPVPTPYPYKTSISTLNPWAVAITADASYLFADLYAGTKVFVTGPYGMAATWTSYNGTPYNDIYGISISPNGSVYMVDFGSSDVFEVSSYGIPVTSWSTYGATPLNSPTAISVAPQNGNVYITDEGNLKVEEFSSQGTPITEWPVTNYPVLVAASPVSPYDVYVVERNEHLIHEFTASGSPVTQWGSEAVSAEVGLGSFAGVQGIVVGPNGNVFITDGDGTCLSGSCVDHLVQEFSPHGTFLAQWGSSGTGSGQFGVNGGPGMLAFDGNGDIYVADPDGARVEVFGQ